MLDQYDASRRHLCTAHDQKSRIYTTNVTYRFHNPLSGVTRYVCEERIPIGRNDQQNHSIIKMYTSPATSIEYIRHTTDGVCI